MISPEKSQACCSGFSETCKNASRLKLEAEQVKKVSINPEEQAVNDLLFFDVDLQRMGMRSDATQNDYESTRHFQKEPSLDLQSQE